MTFARQNAAGARGGFRLSYRTALSSENRRELVCSNKISILVLPRGCNKTPNSVLPGLSLSGLRF